MSTNLESILLFKEFIKSTDFFIPPSTNVVIYLKPKLIENKIICYGSDYAKAKRDLKFKLNQERKHDDDDDEEKERPKRKKTRNVNSSKQSTEIYQNLTRITPIETKNHYSQLKVYEDKLEEYNEKTESKLSLGLVVEKVTNIKDRTQVENIDFNKILKEHKIMMDLKNELFENLKKTETLRQSLERQIEQEKELRHSISQLELVKDEDDCFDTADDFVKSEVKVKFEDEVEQLELNKQLIISKSDAQCQTNFTTMTRAGRKALLSSDQELERYHKMLEKQDTALSVDLHNLRLKNAYNEQTIEILKNRISTMEKNGGRLKQVKTSTLTIEKQDSFEIEGVDNAEEEEYLRQRMIETKVEQEVNKKRCKLINDIVLHSLRVVVLDTQIVDQITSKPSIKRTSEEKERLSYIMTNLTKRLVGLQEHCLKMITTVFNCTYVQLDEQQANFNRHNKEFSQKQKPVK